MLIALLCLLTTPAYADLQSDLLQVVHFKPDRHVMRQHLEDKRSTIEDFCSKMFDQHLQQRTDLHLDNDVDTSAVANDLVEEILTTEFGFTAAIAEDPRTRQVLVLLGESHIQTSAQYELGKNILESFQIIGVEGIPPQEYAALQKHNSHQCSNDSEDTIQDKMERIFIRNGWSFMINDLGFRPSLIRNFSVDKEALRPGDMPHIEIYEGHRIVAHLEYGMPLDPTEPSYSKRRDSRMASSISKTLRLYPKTKKMLAIVGQQHVKPIATELIKRYGFLLHMDPEISSIDREQ